jgi:hypothetical protein
MSDLCIDGCGDIADDIYGQWPLEGHTIALWNGRETALIQKRDEKYNRILEIIHTERTQDPLSLKGRKIEHIFLEDESEKTLENMLEEYDCVFDVTTEHVEDAKSLKAHLKRAGKEIKKGLEKTAKAVKKVAKKTAELIKKTIDAIAHGTKKAAEKVEKFVKDHKKETLIAVATLAAIAGAFIVSGALGSAATAAGGAASGGGSKKREDEEDGKNPAPASPPSNPPPLPDWINELVKSTSSELFLNHPPETSLADAKKQAHDAWDLFNRLQLETENDLASLKKYESQFNPCSKATETILNTVLNDARFDASKASLISRSWPEIVKAGHEKIDHAFAALSAHYQTTATPPTQAIPSFEERIHMSLEIIRQGMNDPKLLNPNLPIDAFFKENQKKCENTENSQTVAEFFETLEDTLKVDGRVDKTLDLHPFLKFVPNPFDPSFTLAGSLVKSLPPLIPLSETQPSSYFETEGIKRKDMMITFIPGMANTFEDAKRNLNHLKQLSGSDLCIEGIYNHTNGTIVDLAEIFFLNYPGYSPNTQNLLGQKWMDFHERNKDDPDAKILHFCHSQGAIHTRNTLKGLPQEIRDRVIVVAIAPAVVISDEMCYKSFNYASKKDIVHRGEDVIAMIGFAIQDASTEDAVMLQQQRLETHRRNKAQLILLDPHKGATGIDHEFLSQTFVHRIIQRLKEYLKE